MVGDDYLLHQLERAQAGKEVQPAYCREVVQQHLQLLYFGGVYTPFPVETHPIGFTQLRKRCNTRTHTHTHNPLSCLPLPERITYVVLTSVPRSVNDSTGVHKLRENLTNVQQVAPYYVLGVRRVECFFINELEACVIRLQGDGTIRSVLGGIPIGSG
jgi:hypothetical protein